jgi:hypothetical protein
VTDNDTSSCVFNSETFYRYFRRRKIIILNKCDNKV